MAAIALSRRNFVFCLAVSGAVVPCSGDNTSEARDVLSSVAIALSTGHPAEALSAFDKSYAKYDELSDDFNGLTNAFQISSEVDVIDETDTEGEIKLTARWSLTLAEQATGYTQSRSAEINTRLVRRGKQWKIVDFAPIAIFQPHS